MRRCGFALLTLVVATAVWCFGGILEVSAQDTSENATKPVRYVGTYDDIPVADNDLHALEQLLRDKWSYSLFELDKYNKVRDSSQNSAMAKKLSLVFADKFEFNAYWADGSDFGTVQGMYTPRSWVEANDAEKVFGPVHAQSTMLVPNYDHILTVEEHGKKVVLEGYHEHVFFGNDIRALTGQSRHLAFETIVFEKVAGVWRVTDYEETVHDVTDQPSPDLPTPKQPGT